MLTFVSRHIVGALLLNTRSIPPRDEVLLFFGKIRLMSYVMSKKSLSCVWSIEIRAASYFQASLTHNTGQLRINGFSAGRLYNLAFHCFLITKALY
jgi:hypothetical protein